MCLESVDKIETVYVISEYITTCTSHSLKVHMSKSCRKKAEKNALFIRKPEQHRRS